MKQLYHHLYASLSVLMTAGLAGQFISNLPRLAIKGWSSVLAFGRWLGTGTISRLVVSPQAHVAADTESSRFGSRLLRQVITEKGTSRDNIHLEDAVFLVLVEEWRCSPPSSQPVGLEILLAAYIKLWQLALDVRPHLEEAAKMLFKNLSSDEFESLLGLLQEGAGARWDEEPSAATVVMTSHHALQSAPEGDLAGLYI
jgi:hypothetical protein